jgi:deoxycytidylate deaminase
VRQEYFLKKAKEMSVKSHHHTHKIGCVLVKRNRIIGSSCNTLKTHPKSPNCYKSIHAEFGAVVDAGFDVKGATAFVFREQKNGTWAIAKPCFACRNFLIKCGIREVIYTVESSFTYEKM